MLTLLVSGRHDECTPGPPGGLALVSTDAPTGNNQLAGTPATAGAFTMKLTGGHAIRLERTAGERAFDRQNYPAGSWQSSACGSISAYIASVLATISGPIILAGHSYGGEVITNAATGNPNVKALVYIAAFGPDAGETSGGILAKFPCSMLTPANLILRPFPGGTDAYINPAVFREVFCADCSAGTVTDLILSAARAVR